MAEHPPLLVFADDWGRHPSSCQHLMSQLLDRYQVWWVNTIGMRAPRFDRATLTRGWEKLRHWSSSSNDRNARPRNLHVVNPRMWPWFATRLDRWINRTLLGRQLGSLIATLPEKPIAVTTLPIVADLISHLPVQRWVYYCVDDFSQWPGLDHRPLEAMEEKLTRQADVVLAVSDTLQRKLAQFGRPPHLLTHGVDLTYWSASANGHSMPELEGLQRPLVVFWGLIDRRMDVSFIRHLCNELNQGTILLVGPEADPDPALYESPRVRRLPALAFDRLPALAREASVLIMPYADLPVTRAMQPLKLKEYLATGKPTVVRDLPAVRPWQDALDLAATPESFVESVMRRLADGLPDTQRMARSRLVQEGWGAKARQFEAWALAPAISNNI